MDRKYFTRKNICIAITWALTFWKRLWFKATSVRVSLMLLGLGFALHFFFTARSEFLKCVWSLPVWAFALGLGLVFDAWLAGWWQRAAATLNARKERHSNRLGDYHER